MNYAEDRADRRARSGTLTTDYVEALESCNDTRLACTLRDVGWNRHAIYHFGRAWQSRPERALAAGDYAQMMELAGYPEVGLVVLLAFRVGVPLKEASVTTRPDHVDPSRLGRPAPESDCGCGHGECGRSPINLVMDDLDRIWKLLREAVVALQEPGCFTAYDLYGRIDRHRRGLLHEPVLASRLSLEMQFWREVDGCRSFPPVLQWLAVKLAYLNWPQWAAEAVVELEQRLDSRLVRQLTSDYKSHHAYWIMIRAMVLGERIKPARRASLEYYHVPVWDRLYNLSERKDFAVGPSVRESSVESSEGDWSSDSQREVQVPLEQWQNIVLATLDRGTTALPPLSILPQHLQHQRPLYLVGDSHVLSLAWQTVRLPIGNVVVVPTVVTGLKAWHCGASTRFFTRTTLLHVLERLSARSIVLSAGEIDCREGLGGERLAGYQATYAHAVNDTVDAYVEALQTLCQQSTTLQQIFVMPVAPHAYKSSGRLMGQAVRRSTTRQWNERLKARLASVDGLYFLGYVDQLLAPSTDDILHPHLDADSTHMNAGFARHLERAMVDCGCDWKLW